MPLRRSPASPQNRPEAGKFRQGARTQKPWAIIAHTGEVEQQFQRKPITKSRRSVVQRWPAVPTAAWAMARTASLRLRPIPHGSSICGGENREPAFVRSWHNPEGPERAN
jgi:hypothetical protein